jgi:hypothetical protein
VLVDDDHIASTRQHIHDSVQTIDRLRASIERACVALCASQEAVRGSQALLSIHVPRPKSVLPAEREMERWRIATQIVRALKDAGLSCELSIPHRPH